MAATTAVCPLDQIGRRWRGVVTYDLLPAVCAALNERFGGWRCGVTVVNRLQRPYPSVEVKPNGYFSTARDRGTADTLPFHPSAGTDGLTAYFSFGLSGWVTAVDARRDQVAGHPHLSYGTDRDNRCTSNWYVDFHDDDTVRFAYTSGSGDEHLTVLARERPDPKYSLKPEWRTEAVVAIARGITESREFSRLSVLADALEDAGCDKSTLIDACRSGRGTWVPEIVVVSPYVFTATGEPVY